VQPEPKKKSGKNGEAAVNEKEDWNNPDSKEKKTPSGNIKTTKKRKKKK